MVYQTNNLEGLVDYGDAGCNRDNDRMAHGTI